MKNGKIQHLWYRWHYQIQKRAHQISVGCKSDWQRILLHQVDQHVLELYQKHPEFYTDYDILNKVNGQNKSLKIFVGALGEDICEAFWVSQQRNVKKPSLGGSVVDMIVDDRRVQIKSSISRQTRGYWVITARKRQRGRYVPYSEYDFDLLAVSVADPGISIPKYIYEIPMNKLIEIGVVSTATSKGKRQFCVDPELNMDRSKFHCLNEHIVWSHLTDTWNVQIKFP
eukprot:710737_1